MLFTALGAILLAAAALPRGAHSSAAADDAKGPAAFEPIAPIDSLMEVVGDFFDGTEDHVKAGKFTAIKRESYALAELLNVSTLAKDHRDNAEWRTLALAARDGAVKVALAGGKKDAAGIQEAHKAFEAACEACHKKFRD
jgi:cytochrome c556